jgi:hypothetical protein
MEVSLIVKRIMTDRTVLVFKTNIQHATDVAAVAPVLAQEQDVLRWHIDTQDIDNVLRIETLALPAHYIEYLMQQAGYQCQELPD